MDGVITLCRVTPHCTRLDRHEGVACLWEAEDGAAGALTFAELRRDANRLAHAAADELRFTPLSSGKCGASD